MKELLTLIIQNILTFEQTSLKFRKGQKPFFDAIIAGLKKGWRMMYIEGPTGMGKTFLESAVAAAVIGNSDIKVLLLTSKITLLKQIQREFIKFVGFLTTGLVGGGWKQYGNQVTIMTYDSFRVLNEAIAKQYAVILMDEGHKGLGEKTKAKLEQQKKFSVLIGFTASATYSAKKSLLKFLKNLAYKLSIVEAVELGMLSNIKVLIASVDIEINTNRLEGETKGQYEERISAEIIREGGNIATARLWKRTFAKKHLRGIALVLTKTQGEDLVKEFAKEKIKAELIHSGMKQHEREDMFERFKKHEFDLLVGMGIIIEGFDDPGVSVAITTYPVRSRVVMTQFPGRSERIDENNPDKIAYIVNMAYQDKQQLFYTDILDGKSEVLQKKKRKKPLDVISSAEMQAAVARKPHSFISSVAVTEEEVAEVLRPYQPVEFLSYVDLKTAVQAAGIKGTEEYSIIQKTYSNWYAVPWDKFKNEYSHEDFFGSKYLSYEELKKAVQQAGIYNHDQYNKVQKEHSNWPNRPWMHGKFKDQYSFEDFFGPRYLDYEDLKKAVQKAGIQNGLEYKKAEKDHHNWYAKPWEKYADEYSHEDFFGSKYLSYEDLKKAVQKAGIKSRDGYKKAQKNHDNWIYAPWESHVAKYSHEDFFGSKYLSYEDLKKAIKKSNVRGSTHYKDVQKNHSDWPSNPSKEYGVQYTYEDFFGRSKKKKFLSYADLKAEVQTNGITDRRIYKEVQKQYPNWPSNPWTTYKDQYSHEDFFGKTK